MLKDLPLVDLFMLLVIRKTILIKKHFSIGLFFSQDEIMLWTRLNMRQIDFISFMIKFG